MSQRTVAFATSIYEAAARQRTELHLVHDPQVIAFFRLTKRLRSSWREIAADDPELLELSKTLGWLANTAVGTPLPLGFENLSRYFVPDEYEINLRRMTLAYPDFQGDIELVIGHLRHLISISVTALGARVAELIRASEQPAIITTRPWLNRQVEQYLREQTDRDDIAVLRDADLRGSSFYDRLIVVGPASWLSVQLLRAVRAERRDIVSLDCFPTGCATDSVLPRSWNPRSSVRFTAVPATSEISSFALSDEIDTEEDVLGNFEVSSMLSRLRANQPHASGEQVTSLVDAEAFQLASGQVLLLATEGRTFALDRHGDEFKVQPRKPADLEPNQFVLLRTQRDRELIAELADRMLGERAEPLRSMQRGWKQALSRRIRSMDANRVAAALRSRGMGSIATAINVRRWAGPDFIHNQDFSTWKILMAYLGLETLAEQLWNDMELIFRAHREAGHRISSAIERALGQLSLEEVQDRMVLPPISDLGEERLAIFEITDRLGPVSDVRFTDLNRPLHV